MRTSTLKKRTLVAYQVDESSCETVINILGVFQGGQDWEAALSEDQGDPEAGRWPIRAWQMRGRRINGDRSRPTVFNAFPQVRPTMPTLATNGR